MLPRFFTTLRSVLNDKMGNKKITMEEELITQNSELTTPEYTDDNIRHLDDMEHIRVRSGMYIGRLGDGQQNDEVSMCF